MTDSAIPLAAIGLVGTILALVVTPLFSLLKANTKALGELAKSSERVASATAQGAKEAKQRNGHLGEQNLKLAQLVTSGNDKTDKILATLQDSATTLARDSHDVAVAVKTVGVELTKGKA